MAVAGTVRLPNASSRRVVEDYAALLAPQLREEFGFVTLVPWSNPQRPDNVIAADLQLDGFWSADEIATLVQRFSTLLVPCTFETQFEKRVVRKLLERLQVHTDFCVFMLQLMEVPGELTREYMNVLLSRHDALLGIGANAVLLDPDDDPDRLRQKVEQEREWFEANARRANAMLANENVNLQNILEDHHELLWESVPRALMPKFAPIDRTLVEAINRVGGYQLIHRFTTVEGKVLLAVHNERRRVVIKVYDKSSYVQSGDLECIYREFRFLTDMLRHPHIVRCHQMLHSVSRVYFVLEFAGMKNLHQHLLDQPGYRLDLEDATDCVTQIAGALAFCHSRDVVHRQVSLEHIVMQDQTKRPFCRLVDFLSATHCPESVSSATVCGDLPCIAPEMALDESYLPRPADCWSLGVVLLEVAGGLGSLMQAVGWQQSAEPRDTAISIKRFFAEDGSHARALATMGGVRSEPVLANLEALLKPNPTQRATMASIAPS